MPILTGKPAKAKLVAALMAPREGLIQKALSALEPTYGSVELASSVFPFTYSDYYKNEMGDGLCKMFCSFGRLIEPDEIVSLKLEAIECEKKFLRDEAPQTSFKRSVNIDPGYLDRTKLVLATTKDCSHRIYLAKGIYGDVELVYRSGSFVCLEWTYLDYREAFAIEFFNKVRSAT
ncbi:MAG: DUF4416 family protein [Candidatus Eisenbacteria bacterium]|nr:DUF4416 family protein [Candidatus Eisenbacteria bacterium]